MISSKIALAATTLNGFGEGERYCDPDDEEEEWKNEIRRRPPVPVRMLQWSINVLPGAGRLISLGIELLVSAAKSSTRSGDVMSKRVVPMIHVPDVRATVDWYKQLGFDVVATYCDDTGDGLSFGMVSFGNTQVMFNEGGEPSTARRREVDLYVYTDDVDELYARLKDHVDVVEAPHDTFYGMHELIIRDVNRFWITFGQESTFTILMSGVSEAKSELVGKAVDSGKLDLATLNIALAAALAGNNAEIIGILKNAGATPPPRIALETLQSYVGKYKGEHGLTAEITFNDGRLFVTPASQQTMSLWPLDQITFRPIAIQGATLSFNVEHGETIGLTFIQDDFEMELKRA